MGQKHVQKLSEVISKVGVVGFILLYTILTYIMTRILGIQAEKYFHLEDGSIVVGVLFFSTFFSFFYAFLIDTILRKPENKLTQKAKKHLRTAYIILLLFMLILAITLCIDYSRHGKLISRQIPSYPYLVAILWFIPGILALFLKPLRKMGLFLFHLFSVSYCSLLCSVKILLMILIRRMVPGFIA